jgi:phosphonate transport system ATP-binding protein
MRLLRRLSQVEGLGVICVLHQPDLARRYADRILGMRQGRMVFDARPDALAEADVTRLYEAAAP